MAILKQSIDDRQRFKLRLDFFKALVKGCCCRVYIIIMGLVCDQHSFDNIVKVDIGICSQFDERLYLE